MHYRVELMGIEAYNLYLYDERVSLKNVDWHKCYDLQCIRLIKIKNQFNLIFLEFEHTIIYIFIIIFGYQ